VGHLVTNQRVRGKGRESKGYVLRKKYGKKYVDLR